MRVAVFTILLVSHCTLYTQVPSTLGDIYDFEIGDEFHYSYEAGYSSNTTHYSFERFVISNKFYSQNLDTVFYERTGTTVVTYPNLSFGSFVDIEYHTNLSDTLTDIDSVYMDPNEFKGRRVNVNNEWGFDSGFDDIYIEGCGNEHHSFDPHYSYFYKDLVFFKKGMEEWGKRVIVGTEETGTPSDFRLFPNPASGFIRLSSLVTITEKLSITLYDSQGSVERTLRGVSVEDFELNISNLSPGLYFLKIQSPLGLDRALQFIKE